jgi:hypothetical protein
MTPGGATSTPVGVARLSARGKLFLEIALVPGELYPELSVGGVERYSGADFSRCAYRDTDQAAHDRGL